MSGFFFDVLFDFFSVMFDEDPFTGFYFTAKRFECSFLRLIALPLFVCFFFKLFITSFHSVLLKLVRPK